MNGELGELGPCVPQWGRSLRPRVPASPTALQLSGTPDLAIISMYSMLLLMLSLLLARCCGAARPKRTCCVPWSRAALCSGWARLWLLVVDVLGRGRMSR